MKKGIRINFIRIRNRLLWVKALKATLKLSLEEAMEAITYQSYFYNLRRFSDKNKAIDFYNSIVKQITELIKEDCSSMVEFVWEENDKPIKSQNIQDIGPNIVKVGSVYILTEEEYNRLHKCHGLLMDMLGTYKQFLQAYESFK